MDRKETGLASLQSTSKQHAADMVDLLGYLNVSKFGVLAFSMFGGSIARRLALVSHDMLKFLILLSPGPCFIDSTPRHVFWNMLPGDIKADILELEDGFLQSLIEKVARFLQESLKSLSPTNGSKSFILEDLHNMVKEFTYVKKFDPGKSEYLTDVPVQIICGELDEFIPPVLSYKVSKIFKEILFQVIPFAGHYFPLDFPEETARLVKEFVQNLIDPSSIRVKGQHSPLHFPQT
jgi:pimeloyl-ACP methyl ester carboxylesterase